jgi:adenosine deaminase
MRPVGSGDVRDLRLLPKVHLHVHLESTVRWSTLADLGAANGIEIPPHLAAGDYEFGGFNDFFVQNDILRECLRRPEDFRRIALEYCEDEAAQGTRYAEVSFTAAGHGERLGDLEMPLLAVLEGLREGSRRYGIEVRVLLDHSRRRSVERAWRTLDLARKHPGEVVAVGLAGDEAFPAKPFAEVFATARAEGVHVVHHAGEALGADSIREAIAAGAQRLGHGVQLHDDAGLIAEVRDAGIPLEVCPTSNVSLGFFPSLEAHPLPRLYEAGLRVTLNTDIPTMIRTTLPEEYARVRDAFGFDDTVVADLARNGVAASFAPPALKTTLNDEITAWLGSPA